MRGMLKDMERQDSDFTSRLVRYCNRLKYERISEI